MHDCRHDHYSLLKGAAKGNDRFMSEHSILLSKTIPQLSQKIVKSPQFEFQHSFQLHNETSANFLTNILYQVYNGIIIITQFILKIFILLT